MICSHSAEVMNAVRDEAYENFKSLGFPTKKVERYKYTDIEKLFEPNYGLNLNRLDIPVNPYDAFRCDVPNLSTSLYFVVNDAFYKKSEPKALLPEGVIVDSLKNQAERNPELIAKYYAKLAKTDEDAITALNTMLAQDGLLVYVPKNIVVDRAIQVINILRSDVDMMVNRRVLIVVEEGAEAKLLFCDHAADDRNFLATQVIEAYVGRNASLDLYCLEETHAKNVRVSNLYIDQQADSRLNHNVITLHNGVTRNRVDLSLSGEGAECVLNGCVIADKEQHVDNNTVIDHKVEHCTSSQLYKYVLDEKAKGAFAGRVLVRHGAQKTSSEMRNQNICATREARMFTQPMLEIYADDVKCSHGSTVGQLNDAAMFYMQQRGISQKEAKLLLEFAFVNEVIDTIRLEPLRDRLHHLVEKRFRGELSKCEGCKLCK
ncbi:MAG: Fe-S cluster assembly protein SufD [Prevotella sp.]|nr:Fe-S cluster assembly protein SufD [Prevotella sp.]